MLVYICNGATLKCKGIIRCMYNNALLLSIYFVVSPLAQWAQLDFLEVISSDSYLAFPSNVRYLHIYTYRHVLSVSKN